PTQGVDARQGPGAPSEASSTKSRTAASVLARSGAPAAGKEVRLSSGLASCLPRFSLRRGSGRKRRNQRVTGHPVLRADSRLKDRATAPTTTGTLAAVDNSLASLALVFAL